MANSTGSGASEHADTRVAVTAAVKDALGRLASRKADVGFLFCSPRHDLGKALGAARAASKGTEFVGCTTAGEFTERGLTHGAVSVLLLSFDDAIWDVGAAPALLPDVVKATQRLAASFAERSEQALMRGWVESTTAILADGLSPGFEKVVAELRKHTRPLQQVVGGGAGDDGALKKTLVGGRGAVTSGAVAVHFFSKSPWGVGVAHGCTPASRRMTITKSSGHVVHTIDDQPAFDVYRAFAAERSVTLEPATSARFLLEHELAILFFDDVYKVRAALGVTDDGSIVFSAEMPEGAPVCIVDAEPERMIAAATTAAKEAAAGMRGKAAGVLVFSCICRGTLLAERYVEEIEAVKRVFPGAPVAGFLSYGEVARFRGKLDGYHNNTIVVAAIPE